MRIFSLTSKDFITGLTQGRFDSRGGLWVQADGINPFVAPNSTNNNNLGMLRSGDAPTDISGAVVVDTPLAGVVDTTSGNDNFLYITGDDGHFYKIDLSGDNAPTDLRSGTPITSARNGIAVFEPRGGTRYLYYWQDTQIGRWDLSGTHPTGWTDNWVTGLTSNANKPVHKMFDEIWYGNGSKIGSIKDDGGGAETNTLNELDFEDNETVTCLSDDGYYLVIGVTKNISGATASSGTRVLFWNKTTSSWQREWTLTGTPTVLNLENRNGIMHATTPVGIYAFTFQTPPQRIQVLAGTSDNGRNHTSSFVYGGAMFWGGNGTILSYGNIIPNTPTALFKPYANMSGGVSMLIQPTITRIFAGTDNDKLYRINIEGGGNTGGFARTKNILLDDEYQINAIEFIFNGPLASGDSINLTIDNGVTTKSVGNVATFAADGAVNRKMYRFGDDTINADQLYLHILLNGGDPLIKQIDVYGERINKK